MSVPDAKAEARLSVRLAVCNTKELRALLWKDFRLSGIVLLAGLCLIAAPYLLFVPLDEWNVAWKMSAALSQFTMALIAGNIIAGERADRSAEFLAYQGASRVAVITSKAILSLITYVVICSFTLVTGKLILPPGVYRESWDWQFSVAAAGLIFFGCSWLFSSFLASPVLCAAIGTMVPFLIGSALSTSKRVTGWPQEVDVWQYCAVIGILPFAAGVAYYVRRKEP